MQEGCISGVQVHNDVLLTNSPLLSLSSLACALPWYTTHMIRAFCMTAKDTSLTACSMRSHLLCHVLQFGPSPGVQGPEAPVCEVILLVGREVNISCNICSIF